MGAPRRDSYVMEVDRGRNCYACESFGHMAHYCRNRGRGRAMVLQLKDLRIGQWKEPCIGLTQENSIKNSVQDGLSYIQIPDSLRKLFLTYSK